MTTILSSWLSLAIRWPSSLIFSIASARTYAFVNCILNRELSKLETMKPSSQWKNSGTTTFWGTEQCPKYISQEICNHSYYFGIWRNCDGFSFSVQLSLSCSPPLASRHLASIGGWSNSRNRIESTLCRLKFFADRDRIISRAFSHFDLLRR